MKATAGGKRASSSPLIAVTLVVLVIAAAFAYVGALQAENSASQAASIKNLQNNINTLALSNAALQAKIQALTIRGNSTAGIDPVTLYDTAKASVVTVQGTVQTVINTFFGPVTSIGTVLGSGFVVHYQNTSYIITNFHVVDHAFNLTVTFSNGNGYSARTVGSDPYADMAVLAVSAPPSEFVPLTIASPTMTVGVGEGVYAIGNPFGLSGSMTYGIVSQTGRTITESTSTTQVSIPDTVQFSAPINPGNSGGPLLDTSGLVIGMTTASVSNSQGLYFAIPATTIVRELSSLVSSGTYTNHPYLGVSGVDMSYQLAQAMNEPATYGVLVVGVANGSPASLAGIHRGTTTTTISGTTYTIGGDIIVSVNGVRVINQDGLAAYLEENTVAGQSVVLGIVRSGSNINATVALGTIPNH